MAFFRFMVSHTLPGFLEEKTNTLPCVGAISTALANEVVYAIEPSSPYLTPIRKYLPKASVFFAGDDLFEQERFLVKQPVVNRESNTVNSYS